MKANTLLFLTLFIALFMIINSHNLQTENENHAHNGTEYNTFLVKTKLTKEELETLLAEGQTKLVNLKKKEKKLKEQSNTLVVEEITNTKSLLFFISLVIFELFLMDMDKLFISFYFP